MNVEISKAASESDLETSLARYNRWENSTAGQGEDLSSNQKRLTAMYAT